MTEPSSEMRTIRAALEAFGSAVARPLIDCGDAIFVEKVPWLYERRNDSDDLTAIEIRVNEFHVRSFTNGSVTEKHRGRSTLMKLGRAVIIAWSNQIQRGLDSRSILFYLGGRDEVILRFHLERPDDPGWTDIGDREFLRRSRLEVYRATSTSLQRIA